MLKQSTSVVIPNHNGIELLPIVLSSVINALKYSEVDYEIIIVDDCSTDNSVINISKLYPEVKFLVNEKNLGFSKSVNKGVYASKNELVLILNNDVKLNIDYFENQFKFFLLEDTFGVNGTIINWDDEQLQGGGKILKKSIFKIKSNTNYYIKNPKDEKFYKTAFLTGTNALVSKSKFIELGGFCYLFSPFYVEDIELSMRALRMGYKCYYSPKSVCKHQISATIKKHSSKQKILKTNIRNKFYLHIIHLNGFNLIGWFIQLICESIFRFITFKKPYLKAIGELLSSFNAVIVFRNQFIKKLKLKGLNNDASLVIEDLNKEILSYESIEIKCF